MSLWDMAVDAQYVKPTIYSISHLDIEQSDGSLSQISVTHSHPSDILGA